MESRHTAWQKYDEGFGGFLLSPSFEPNPPRQSGPSLTSFAWEFPRLFFEASRLSLSWPLLLQQATPTDGHPVMVLPGFLMGDDSTFVLRRFLSRLGHQALPWLHGRNTGRPEQVEGAALRFYRAYRTSGEKISLVGQSLGGIYARQIARRFPDAVRCVITLGSPFAAEDVEHAALSIIPKLYKAMTGHSAEEMRKRLMGDEDPRTPLGVPSTAIYSKTDGVAAWEACVDGEGELVENIEVRASHTGMAINPDVFHVVADRLAQDPDNWQPFDGSQGCRSWFYPNPSSD